MRQVPEMVVKVRITKSCVAPTISKRRRPATHVRMAVRRLIVRFTLIRPAPRRWCDLTLSCHAADSIRKSPVCWRRCHQRHVLGSGMADAQKARYPAALALGALALGAFAVGALAVGYLAIGRLVVKRARIGWLEVDELVIRRIQRPE